ncbi:MAG: response regulator [Treponema sp.]|jgi:two-component system response regulator YesN|nr:response regulator [Treponema sp.]
MYKVFLVEDEIVVREGIRNSIPWEKTAYTLAGEAPDGEMALSIIKDIKPDILITDIKMPFMDGLALSRIVKKTLPWIKVIILSGHDEFEYARGAISIGVEEYLLKPVSSRDMLAALDKIAARIDEEKEKLLSIEHLKKQVQSHGDILRERWLRDFVSGGIPSAEIIEQARELGLDLIAHSYIAALISILLPEEGAGGKQNHLLPVKMIIESITEKYANVILFQADEKKYVMLIKGAAQDGEAADSGEPADSHESVEESVYSIAQAIKYEVERNTECRVAVGIGPVVERIGEISRSCRQARMIIDRQAAMGLAQIADDRNMLPGEKGFDQTILLNIEGDLLLERLKYASKKDVDAIIRDYAKLLEDSRSDTLILEYYIFGDIIVAASKIIEELRGDIKAIIPFSLDQYEIREIINSREVFYEKIRALFNAVIEFRESRTGGRYQSVILKARAYIDRRYGDQDISLHTVASHVGISPNHLSTVFAQETGEKFIEYLTRVRIERAKQLLKNTTIKSADIAYETGFSDPHYFSFIFKKNTGLSPREYRQNPRGKD